MLGAIVAVAAALRFYGLENQSLWGDEIASVFLTGSSLSESLGRVQLNVHPPLYFYLLSLWTGLFGTSEFALRMPSVLAGILAVPLVYRLGSRLFGERAGLAAAALMSVSAIEIYYSQEVRSYAFLVLGGLLSMDALTAGWASGARRHFVYYVLVTTGLLYVHYFGFLLLLAQAAGLGLVWLTAPRTSEGGREKFGFPLGSAAVPLGAIPASCFPTGWRPGAFAPGLPRRRCPSLRARAPVRAGCARALIKARSLQRVHPSRPSSGSLTMGLRARRRRPGSGSFAARR